MLTTTPTSNNVQMIISALAKKSKRTLSYREKSLKKQAEYFSPAYRDFIHKVISNNSLKIVFTLLSSLSLICLLSTDKATVSSSFLFITVSSILFSLLILFSFL